LKTTLAQEVQNLLVDQLKESHLLSQYEDKNTATLSVYARTCLKTELKRTKRLEELQA
jgi:hypothetical protein